MSVLTLEAKLERTNNSTPWGFRMQGGKDFNSALTIARVDHGSLAAKCGLLTGDIILKIGSQTTDVLKHEEAKKHIMGSGNRLDLLLQRGGNAGYERFNGPTINTNWNSAPSQMSPQSAPSPQQKFNSTPRPFGGQSSPAAPSRPSFEINLSQQTQNMSINSVPKEAPVFQRAAEKYSEQEDPAEPAKPQSKSFKYLQNLMDEGKELNTALKPRNTPASLANSNKPSEPASVPPPNPIAAPIGQGSKPGTVKAIVSQRYNNPLGLYSSANASSQLEGQSKFLMDKDEGSGNISAPEDLPPPPPPADDSEYDEQGRKRYIPSETFMMVQEEVGLKSKEEEPGPSHSRTFKMLQAQLQSGGAPPAPVQSYKPNPNPGYQPGPAPVVPVAAAPVSKPWAPAPAPAPVSNASPRPFGGAPPKPTGKGATRGKKGDAAMNAAMPTTGRIPVCHSCNSPIRGPFVTALGNCWCPDHFICANPQCGTKLLDIGFVEENGYLYCERDYAQHFAPQCDKCGRAVIGECVNALDKSFHPECFLCAACNQTIGGNKFHLEEGKFYCEKDWATMFQTMCAGCDFPIEPGDRWVEAMTKNFHSECFNCSTCQVNLEGQQFCAKGGKPYCKKHAR